MDAPARPDPPPLTRDRFVWILGGVYLLFVLVLCPLAAPPLDVHDEGGKYVFLPSVFLDGDLDFANQHRGYYLALKVTPTGYSHHQWGIGPSLLWSPFFLLGHGMARAASWLGHPFGLDGYSYPYLLMTAFGTLVYGWAGLVLLYDLLRRLHGGPAGFMGAFLAFFSSLIPYYLFARPIHDHGLVFAGVSATLWAFYRLLADPDRISSWALTGALTGLVMTLRPDTPLVLLSVLVAAAGVAWRRMRSGAWLGPACFLACAAFFYAPQPLANRVFWGCWFGSSGDDYHSMTDFERAFGLSFLVSPDRWRSLLFNPSCGLLLQTPFLVLAVPGLWLRMRREPFPTVGWLLYPAFLVIGLLTLTDRQHGLSWALYRYLGNAAPMLALGCAEAMARLERRGAAGFRIAAAGGILAVGWLVLQCQQINYLRPDSQPAVLHRILKEVPATLEREGLKALFRPGSPAQMLVPGKGLRPGILGRLCAVAVPLTLLAWMAVWAAAVGRFQRLDRDAADRRLRRLLGLSALALVPLMVLEVRQPRRTETGIYEATMLRLRYSIENPLGHLHDEALLEKARRLGGRLGRDGRVLAPIEGFIRFRRNDAVAAERLWLETIERVEDPLALAGLAEIARMRGDAEAEADYRRRRDAVLGRTARAP